jgi:probable HAF family extracellular repeat protein
MTDIHSATLFPSGSLALGINNSGLVIGYGWISGAIEHAFLYTGGKMVDLGTLSGYSSSIARGINDLGQVVGFSAIATGVVSHAFLYSNGIMTDLGIPAGATGSSAAAINHSGQIAGSIGTVSSSHAALYSNGAWTDLGGMPGATLGTTATGINDAGRIIGQAIFPQVLISPARPGHRRVYKPITRVGFVIQNSAFVDLDSLITPNSGFVVTGAVGINNSGAILCNAKTSVSESHAVLLTPK